jgi:hypothetical protein
MELIDRIIRVYQTNNFALATGKAEINICYLEGCDKQGNPNDDRLNEFNDRRVAFSYFTNEWKILGNWEATTEPGFHYTVNPMNQLGAARIAFGYYKAWRVGIHGNSEPHEALVQVSPVKVYRDANKDGLRTGDKLHEGLFGINQHYGYDLPQNNIGKASAGCLVGRSRQGHREFMALVKSDPRFLKDRNYVFGTAIIDGSKL